MRKERDDIVTGVKQQYKQWVFEDEPTPIDVRRQWTIGKILVMYAMVQVCLPS